MNPDTPLFKDYDIQGGTSSSETIPTDSITSQDVIPKIGDKNELSKPRRKLIRARIISPDDKS